MASLTPRSFIHRSTQAPQRSRKALLLSALASAACATTAAHAQWTSTTIHPFDAVQSVAYDTTATRHAGNIQNASDLSRASLWNAATQSWTNLHPATGQQSIIFGMDNNQQTGVVSINNVNHASLWNGTAASWVDLHPSNASESQARRTFNNQQVGFARINNVQRATLWNGTAASRVDLHPAAVATGSMAYGVTTGQQVGRANLIGSYTVASLWSGTAESWINLNPVGSVFSEAYGVHNGQQVGIAQFPTALHAALWTGSAASFVDLHPSGATFSVANAVSSGVQVGRADIDNASRASLWLGTADSWVNLHSFLPAQYISSVAWGVWSDGSNTVVAGTAFNASAAAYEAVIWTNVPAPSALAMTCAGGSILTIRRRRHTANQ